MNEPTATVDGKKMPLSVALTMFTATDDMILRRLIATLYERQILDANEVFALFRTHEIGINPNRSE